ncbi:hypothetical protein [Bacillus sp. MMSF_3328]|uniref:hypothetical protein n=1 Tax=Bacillus TaxID=1386 RepID=UPI00273D7403|nr:hypothetical protein [Bacillus sp. MMSF_3328]
MAKSKAKKLRAKMVREGKRNPESKRSPYALIAMSERRTKTKKDLLYNSKHKGQSGSFYFALRMVMSA